MSKGDKLLFMVMNDIVKALIKQTTAPHLNSIKQVQNCEVIKNTVIVDVVLTMPVKEANKFIDIFREETNENK